MPMTLNDNREPPSDHYPPDGGSLVSGTRSGLPAATVPLEELEARGAATARRAITDGTRAVYARAVADFIAWCRDRGVGAFPAEPVTLVAWGEALREAGYARSTIEARIATVGLAHRTRDLEDPTADRGFRLWRRGLRRELPAAPNRKAALTADLVLRMLPAGDNPAAVRDRAILLLGLAGGFRRSEVVALDVRDVAEVDRGLLVTVRRSKTDQEGEGASVGILYARNPKLCAPSALRDWLAVRRAESLDAPIFTPITKTGKVRERRLTGEAVRQIVERHATAAGLDTVSPHSLRAGFATTAAVAGKPLEAIARHGRWRSLDMVLRYVRVAQVFEGNPTDVF